jgi:hypothetical protein
MVHWEEEGEKKKKKNRRRAREAGPSGNVISLHRQAPGMAVDDGGRSPYHPTIVATVPAYPPSHGVLCHRDAGHG